MKVCQHTRSISILIICKRDSIPSSIIETVLSGSSSKKNHIFENINCYYEQYVFFWMENILIQNYYEYQLNYSLKFCIDNKSN